MKLVNCTPHAITLFCEEENQHDVYNRTIPPSGICPRVEEENFFCRYLTDEEGKTWVSCTKKPGRVEGLPEPEKDTLLIVSRMVLDASDREDLCAPDTGPGSVVRDSQGRILGVKRLIVKK